MLGLVLGLSTLATACASSRLSDGPLKEQSENSSVAGSGTAVFRVGQFFDVSVIPPRNPGRKDAVFQRLEPADATRAEGLEMRYAVVRIGPCPVIGSDHGWPPSGGCKRDLLPVNGFHLRPGKQVSILVGAAARRGGKWLIPAFRLHYKVGEKSYAATYYEGLELKVRG